MILDVRSSCALNDKYDYCVVFDDSKCTKLSELNNELWERDDDNQMSRSEYHSRFVEIACEFLKESLNEKMKIDKNCAQFSKITWKSATNILGENVLTCYIRRTSKTFQTDFEHFCDNYCKMYNPGH